jgi:general secretion pathway protein L
LFYKNLLGIYIDESGVQCTTGHKFLPGLMPAKNRFFNEKTNVYDSLKTMLDQVPPSRSTGLYVALPRKLFFTRQIVFPALPLDDVRDSVVNSLASYCHLPLEEIYYDAVFTKLRDKRVNVLIYYAARKKLDVFINIIKESGHLNSLESIGPFSYGAGLLFGEDSLKKKHEKFGLIIKYPDVVEIAIYSKKKCVDSFLLDVDIARESYTRQVDDFLDHHDISIDKTHEIIVNDQFVSADNGLKMNGGNVALAPVNQGVSLVHMDENVPRIKLFNPLKILFPLFVVLTAMMVYLTLQIKNDVQTRQTALDELKKEINVITAAINPIVEARDALKKAAEYKEDVEVFVKTRPPLFTYINDLARVVPEGTWFAHLSYQPGVIAVQGEGDDVLTVIDALRKSDYIKEAQLKGSVSRTNEGKDKFRIELILDEPVDVIEGQK